MLCILAHCLSLLSAVILMPLIHIPDYYTWRIKYFDICPFDLNEFLSLYIDRKCIVINFYPLVILATLAAFYVFVWYLTLELVHPLFFSYFFCFKNNVLNCSIF